MSHDVEMIYALFLWSTYYEMYVTILGSNGWGRRGALFQDAAPY